ncbi:NAD(P)H-hydrate dehydratase [Desulfosarcina sp. OttesenSCG-928-A07]|nr:NAD(P)H-hydrate dehydratase [Desulfosarcina sp. OttesenSCG-928-A07]
MNLVTADEMRRMDRTTIESFGIPGQVLMENAGRGATVFFLDTLYRHHPGPVGIVAGPGNNGGDGFVMARYLHQRGIAVTVFLLADRGRIKGDALSNLIRVDKLGISVKEIPDVAALESHKTAMAHISLWVDAILGTGLSADVRGHLAAVIEFVNSRKQPVFAVDIASGLDTDTGAVHGVCIRAAATATFGFAKVGHLVYPGRELTGNLKIIDIGIPPMVADETGCSHHLITPATLMPAARSRRPTAHKGTSGHLLVLAGAPGKTGAAAMSAMAALRAGAGLVTLGIPASLNPVLETLAIEAMTVKLPETSHGGLDASAAAPIQALMAGKQCLAIGPGLGTDPSTGQLVSHLVATSELPMVVDADGLNLMADNLSVLDQLKAPLVITPHPGEMARLCGCSVADIQKDRITAARSFAQTHRVCVVLKGASTVVARPDGHVFVNPTGNSGMAAGGMGDVLTGLIAGLITQGVAPDLAARAGVYLHGAAADHLAQTIGPKGYLATDVMAAIPKIMGEMTAGGHPGIPAMDALGYHPRICPASPKARNETDSGV